LLVSESNDTIVRQSGPHTCTNAILDLLECCSPTQ